MVILQFIGSIFKLIFSSLASVNTPFGSFANLFFGFIAVGVTIKFLPKLIGIGANETVKANKAQNKKKKGSGQK